MVAGRMVTKRNKFWADGECKGPGFVSEDILFSEIFHQINCQGSNSPSRTGKHVQTSFACRQWDANCLYPDSLEPSCMQKHKSSQAVHTASRIQPSTCGKEFKFQRCLAATGFLWSLITN